MTRKEVEKKVRVKGEEFFKKNPLKEKLMEHLVYGALWWFDNIGGDPEKEKKKRYIIKGGGRSYGNAQKATAFDFGVMWCKELLKTGKIGDYGK